MHYNIYSAVWLVGLYVVNVNGQTWCNKNYMSSEPIVPPGGHFTIPPATTSPRLSLRCAPSLRPYLPGDVGATSNAILIDTPVRFSNIPGSLPLTLDTLPPILHVTVSTEGKTIATGDVNLNVTKEALPLSLSALTPRNIPYNISCTAVLVSHVGNHTFQANSSLTFLPDPPAGIGSVTKMDLRTGALLARPADGKGGDFAPVFPIGFYTDFDNYLAKNLSKIDELKSQGFTVVHPVPTFSNPAALEAVLDRMQEVGLYLMYDMRFTYMNTTSVTQQVNNIKARPNLLLWYTADEPDGTSDPFSATTDAYSLINSLDGGPPLSQPSSKNGGAGYHPVSLVLNCQDYLFNVYSAGADIILQDTYMIGNNVTFSSQWGTPCTVDYGDCGCDNCRGEFEDISRRMDDFRDRLFIDGWDRTKAVWTVPQAFGNETYWKRYPTGKEWVVQSILGINHGGLGVIPWDDPTTADIKASASSLAKALPQMTPFIFSHDATFQQITLNRVDVGIWVIGSRALVLATNMNYQQVSLSLQSLPNGIGTGAAIAQVFDSGARADANNSGFTFDQVGSGAWVLTKQ